MLTTTIGAYPKPDSVAIETWFGARTRRPSEGYDAALAEMGAEVEGLLDEAVREVVREQVEAGVDIPTDGELDEAEAREVEAAWTAVHAILAETMKAAAKTGA